MMDHGIAVLKLIKKVIVRAEPYYSYTILETIQSHPNYLPSFILVL